MKEAIAKPMRVALTAKRPLQRLILPVVLAIGVALGAAAPAAATSATDLPRLPAGSASWVVDRADVLSPVNEGKLSDAFERLARETGREVRAVTVRGLDYGETVDSFADELFQHWYPDASERARQVLLVLDTLSNDRAIRTGERARAQLGEGVAESIVADTMGVPIRSGNNYNQAFLDAHDRLSAVLTGEPDPGPPEVEATIDTESTFAKSEETDTQNAALWVGGLLIAATLIPMGTYFAYIRRPLLVVLTIVPMAAFLAYALYGDQS